jgi:hypothetical protein
MSNLESTNQESTASYDNFVGPGVTGKGAISIVSGGRSVVLYYSPKEDETRARVLYAINSVRADTPLPVRQEFKTPGASSVYITYDVAPGADIQISWSLQ